MTKTMAPPNKPTRWTHIPNDSNDTETPPSNNLWIGNLSMDVTDSDLRVLFEKYGALDSVTTHTARSFAFVYFKRIEEAKSAKDALQGIVLKGNAVKIDFAKPAKPCKSLWVGGIGSSVSKEVLEAEFLKFGKVQELRFLRDRNTAFVDYFRLEDASQALKSMNGKKLSDHQIRVDFLRSQPSRREHFPDFRDATEGQLFNRSMGPFDSPWMPPDFMRDHSELTHFVSKRQQHSQSSGGRNVNVQPSKILWIGYPPTVHVDEQMLHNAMILFGEIERIKCYGGRHYSFVEFRSVDEARLAKEGLQGKLFNDPRILIEFSNSGLVPDKDYPGFYPGIKGPRLDSYSRELPFQPAHMEIYSHSHPMVPNSFSGPLPPHGIHGPDMVLRPLIPQGSFEPLLPGPEFSDVAMLSKLQGTNPNTAMGGLNWRKRSPAPVMLSSPSAGMKPPFGASSGGWDVFDVSELQRESKRSRIDNTLSNYDASKPLINMDDQGLGLEQLYGHAPLGHGGASARLSKFKGKNHVSSFDAGVATPGTSQTHPDLDYVWRGVIAKGGVPVCRARCVPIDEGIGSEIPQMVNISARTGLDMLTKHYADAVGFNIVFFLPDSEEDFASYTDFLRFLGTKNRAGVAKFNDGTTLFLVPPSDFLAKVLNVVGPERLYGVVLKFPEHAPSGTSVQPQNVSRQHNPTQTHSIIPQEDRVLQVDYNMVSHEDLMPLPKGLGPMNYVHSVPPINNAAVSQAGISLTPELIANLASLLPASENFSVSESAQSGVGSSTLRPLLTTTAVPDKGLAREWKYESEASEQTGHALQQLGSGFKRQAQIPPQLLTFPAVPQAPSEQGVGSTQVQEQSFNLSQQGVVSFTPLVNFPIPSQSGQFAVSLQVDRFYQHEMPQDIRKSNGMGHGTDVLGSYRSSDPQFTNSATLSNVIQGDNASQQQTVMPLPPENVNLELTNQVQQLQSALYGAGQGTSEVEADKNERYQSTLQFAANLLFQIQQQQQQQLQPGAQAGQGSGNQ